MKIKGTLSWAFINTPDTKFDTNGVWRISVAMADTEAAKLKAAGLKPKRNDDGVFEYKFKRSVKKKKGEGNNTRPVVVDSNLNPLTDLIGNGSEGYVQFAPYTWKNSFGTGTGADLQGIQVTKLVPYAGGNGGADGSEFSSEGEQEFTKEPVAPTGTEEF